MANHLLPPRPLPPHPAVCGLQTRPCPNTCSSADTCSYTGARPRSTAGSNHTA